MANNDKRSSLLQKSNYGQVEKDFKFRSSDSISVSHRRNLSVSIHFNLEGYFSQDITNEQIWKVLHLGRLRPYLQTLHKLNRFASDKHSSSLRRLVNYDRKKLRGINNDPTVLYDNEYASIIDIYFYEYFL